MPESTPVRPLVARRAALKAALAAGALGVLGGCSVPGAGGGGGGAGALPGGQITAPVTPRQVARHGKVTLRMIADSGDQDFLKRLGALYEKRYPNVELRVETKAFDDFSKTIVNTMSGPNPPDLVQGNQGYGVDALLVQGGLLRPLDDVSHAYGWDLDFPSGATSQFRWSADGRIFGTGNLWGISQSNEYVGVFSNRKKLRKLGLEPPETYGEFTAALTRAHTADERPLMLGNVEQFPATQLLGTVQAQYVPVSASRAWINGVPGTSFVSDGNRRAAATVRDWARKGWLGSGYDGLGADDAVTRFTGGEGVFLVAGSWNSPAVIEGLGRDGSFTALRKHRGGRTAAVGGFGLAWHISAKTENAEAAAAFLGMMQGDAGAQVMADVGRIPVRTKGVTFRPGLPSQQAEAGRRMMDDDGQTFYFDWASTSMLDTIGSATQDLLAGRLGVDRYLAAVQKDWRAFRKAQDAAARKQPGREAGG